MASWYKLSSFDENEERTKKILEKFGIDRYHFVTINGFRALIIDINLNNYRIEVDDYNEELLVRKKKYTRRGQRHKKEYMEVIRSFKNDAIYSSIKFVSEDSQL